MWRTTAVLALLLATACGGSSRPRIRPSSPFEAVHARFFDDAADFVRDPVALGGQWAAEWDDELRGRVGYADTIARVKIETLRTSTDAQQRRTFHLVCRILETLRGITPDDERISVSVSEGAGGFETIARNERRVVEGEYLLFIKWYEADGEVRSHWHLSPSTRRLLADVNRMISEAAGRTARQN